MQARAVYTVEYNRVQACFIIYAFRLVLSPQIWSVEPPLPVKGAATSL